MLQFAETGVGFDDGAVKTEVAAFEQLVVEEGLQHDFQGGLIDFPAQTGADDRKRGVVGGAFGEIVAEEGTQGEAVLATAGDGPLAGEVFEEADHEHLEVNRRVDPWTPARAGLAVGGAADFSHRFGKPDLSERFVQFAVEGSGRSGRQMIPRYPELPLFRGLRVSFLEHP